MKIKSRVSQYRRDFTAIYVCEHCGAEKRGSGYDDAYFHQQVIPAMVCDGCGEAGGQVTSEPIVPEHAVI